MRTSHRAKINPAYHPRIDDGSDRCMVVQCVVMDICVHADQGAHTRQTVRNIPQKRPAFDKTNTRKVIKTSSKDSRGIIFG
eukprot:9485360-Pyramimonas_sp.AAC.1